MISKTVGTMLVLLALGASAPLRAQTAAPPSIDAFFQDPQVRKPLLSPNGRFVAAAMGTVNGTVLAVIDLDRTSTKVVAGFGDADIGDYAWASDERLVFSVRSTKDGNIRHLNSPGLWSVGRDGDDQRMLIEPKYAIGAKATGSRIASRVLPYNWMLHSVPQDGSGDVLVTSTEWDSKGEAVNAKFARLNASTGLLSMQSEGAPNRVIEWVADVMGRPAALVTQADGRYVSYLRGEEGQWQRWQSGDAYTERIDSPYWSDGNGVILVRRRTEAGFEALYRLDPKTFKREAQALVSTPGYDFSGSMIYDRASRQLVGVNYTTDGEGTAWLHPRLREIQAAVDKRLPGRVNLLQCSDCLNTKRVLVSSASDKVPGEFYLYDIEKGALALLAAERPAIKAAQMGQRDLMRIKARDGLEIPVMVTLPQGDATKGRPAVVLVHGGPNVRGTDWTWSAEAQFLASRGYVVIEPEFRGSTGYGWQLFRAGWKQWGMAMQDDIADATQWAVQKGWVDAKRVCIAGASYGGYATLMGLIRYPDLYRCGINWVGVTDIDYLFSLNWSDASDEWKTYGMPQLVGDPVKDAAQLKQNSPLLRAAEIRRPVLLAYGGEDRRVPFKHGEAFRDALKRHGHTDHEWLFYGDEGHGWRKLDTHRDFWSRVERFLDRHIGAGRSTANAAE